MRLRFAQSAGASARSWCLAVARRALGVGTMWWARSGTGLGYFPHVAARRPDPRQYRNPMIRLDAEDRRLQGGRDGK